MLKRIRVIIASLCIALLTLLFLDFTGTLRGWFGWLTKIQLIPAILVVNAGVVVALVLLTLLFGRIYCSVICPLGIFQDGISYISGRRKGKKKRFHYSGAKFGLRYGVLALFVIALVAGASVIASLLDPYAAYGRIASDIFAPLYRLGNNLLAWGAERMDSYAFYGVNIWIKSGIVLGVAALTAVVVGILAWRNGRTYCNTICPVGTVLGFLSKFSLFRPTFNAEKCTQCGLCERTCKASCIDAQRLTIDHSRCVTCFNCVGKCRFGAMTYTYRRTGKTPDTQPEAVAEETAAGKEGVSRRDLLTIAGAFAVAHTVKAQQLHVDGGLAEIEDKKMPERKTPLVPPGAQSLRNINQHCTACQLCVSACPNDVLRPSGKLATLMQPEMWYERGYCRPECTECSQVCPAGAIKPITPAEKTSIAIGQAVWIKDNCVVNTDGVRCTTCQRNCPTGAILLVDRNPGQNDSPKIPAIDKELCIGCGACEYLCPARPFSAIYVEGYQTHHV